MTIDKVTRDNTCNSENDFDYDFTFSVFGSKLDEWYYDDENQFVGICQHMGGDVRGNYSGPRFFRVGGNLAESGFIDWMISWQCASGPDQETVDRINEECMAGYHQNPTCHLADIFDTSDCEWINGEAHVTTDDGVYVVSPWYYGGDVGGEVLSIPEAGNWLHDVSIDSDLWIDSVLRAGDAEEITETVVELMDYVHGSQPDWDDSLGVVETLRVFNMIDAQWGEGATAAIVQELSSDALDGAPEDLREDIENLRKTLLRVVDNAYSSDQQSFDNDLVYDFMTNAGV